DRKTPELGVRFVAVRRVQPRHAIVADHMAFAQRENPAEFHSGKAVAFDQDILRGHFDARIIHGDAEVAVGIIFRRAAIGAGVFAHGAVVETIQVDAFSVDFFELVVLIGRRIYVARGIDAYRRPQGLEVHDFGRESDAGTLIALHQDAGGVSHLNGIAADLGKCDVHDLAPAVARRAIA